MSCQFSKPDWFLKTCELPPLEPPLIITVALSEYSEYSYRSDKTGCECQINELVCMQIIPKAMVAAMNGEIKHRVQNC